MVGLGHRRLAVAVALVGSLSTVSATSAHAGDHTARATADMAGLDGLGLLAVVIAVSVIAWPAYRRLSGPGS